MNTVALMGRLAADPEIKVCNNGKKCVSFTVAVQRRKKDAGADFVDCIAFDKSAELISQHFCKGSKICLQGYLNASIYEKQDGTKGKSTKVIVTQFDFVDSSRKSDAGKPDKQTDNSVDYPSFDDDELDF